MIVFLLRKERHININATGSQGLKTENVLPDKNWGFHSRGMGLLEHPTYWVLLFIVSRRAGSLPKYRIIISSDKYRFHFLSSRSSY
jgi:hypothetical protein